MNLYYRGSQSFGGS